MASYEGNTSIYIKNFTNGLDMTDGLVSPTFNTSSVIEPKLSFKVAFARKNASSSDILRIEYSYDCGNNWGFIGLLTGPLLQSVSDFRTSEFIPTNESEWKHVDIKLGSVLKSKENVLIRFQFTSGGGNNIFIDNVNIQSLTGIEDIESLQSIRVYPNPVDDVLNIDFSGSDVNMSKMQVRDISGKVVKSINASELAYSNNGLFQLNVSDFSPGFYLIQITSEGNQSLTKKFVVR